ncbi:peroxiredoxin [Caulobacter sp. Root1472]|uniref:peroxiredoxin n=1 Tax=Caulobacter sp. Root1472 TaxID=1736470 RepID=UPI0006FB0E1D|nr:peroxiredoxin [Caulobacter sp. Root1472]KQZ33890.1 alkyl hydroperoxide reductase [Caulobacter sp. Root1472]
MSDLQPGDKAPDFDLATDTGRVSLSGLKGKAVVLYFYPKDDTAGCTSQALQFSSEVEEFAKMGAVIVGVSKDSAASHAKFRKKHDLTVDLAADPTGETVEAYGAWVEKSMYGRKYMGIDRSTFLIDREGVVRAVWRKVKVPNHIKAVLTAARALKEGTLK